MEIPLLYYLNENNNWIAIPTWAEFMIRTGAEFSKNRIRGRRLNLLLTVPSRIFVAPFIAFGVMNDLYAQEFDENSAMDYFEKISNLDYGTPLIYYKGDRALKALFTGVDNVNGEKRIRVQITGDRGGKLTDLLNYRNALKVRVAEQDDIKLPKSQIGRVTNVVSPFLEKTFHNINLRCVLTRSNIDILFVGNKINYKHECLNSQFAVKDGKRFYSGCLNEVLKIKTFTADRSVYRSDVLSSRRMILREIKGELRESSIVVFDGASNFLAYRDYITDYHWVIILDRTEAAYEQALNVIYNRFIEDRLSDSCLCFDSLSIPRGIEILSWEETL